MRDNRCPQGCPRVLNPDGYWVAVTNEMRRLGYCAINDGEELAVKNTCYPAWF